MEMIVWWEIVTAPPLSLMVVVVEKKRENMFLLLNIIEAGLFRYNFHGECVLNKSLA